MKRDIAEYVSLCDTCQRVKVEHQRPAGLLQPLKISEWKWEEIGMDFIFGLPRTQAGYDLIWVIVDRFTKVANFIPIKTTYSAGQSVGGHADSSQVMFFQETNLVCQSRDMREFKMGQFFTPRPLKFRELAYKRREARFVVLTVEPRLMPSLKGSLH
jgi:hypothetical protein